MGRGPLRLVRVYPVVRLSSGRYSVAEGTIGIVMSEIGGGRFAVQWVSAHVGSSSVPIAEDDLEGLGSVSFPAPPALTDAQLLRTFARYRVFAVREVVRRLDLRLLRLADRLSPPGGRW